MKKLIKRAAAWSVAATALLALLHQMHNSDVFFSSAVTAGTMAYHFCMRLLVGSVFNKTMNNRADHTKKWYRLRPFEEKLYRKLRVKAWKDKLPTYDPSLFSLEEHTLPEIVGAMCQAELVHETIVLLSFLPLFASLWFGSFPVFLITSLLAALADMFFVVMQRYNRARVVRLIGKQK